MGAVCYSKQGSRTVVWAHGSFWPLSFFWKGSFDFSLVTILFLCEKILLFPTDIALYHLQHYDCEIKLPFLAYYNMLFWKQGNTWLKFYWSYLHSHWCLYSLNSRINLDTFCQALCSEPVSLQGKPPGCHCASLCSEGIPGRAGDGGWPLLFAIITVQKWLFLCFSPFFELWNLHEDICKLLATLLQHSVVCLMD